MAGLRATLSTLRLHPRERRRMTRGQDGSLFLSCIELSSTTLCQSPGAPCCRHYPGTATGGTTLLIRPVMSAFPGRVAGSACASSFSRLTQRSLALRPAHSRCHQFVARLPEGFRHFVTSMPVPVASGWSGCRAGLAPAGKRRLFTAHTHSRTSDCKLRRREAVVCRYRPCTACSGSAVFMKCPATKSPAGGPTLRRRRAAGICRSALESIDAANH